jgi:hypothetical protein
MAYDEDLDARVAEIVEPWGTTRKLMFGGTCHLLNGNLMAGVYKDMLILRMGEEAASAALEEDFVRPFDITGRPMRGWAMVEPSGVEGGALVKWLELARHYVSSLPPK